MTTVVVSDLHLGLRSGRDLLRDAAVRRRLWERVEGVDRLVLLGDAVELRQGPVGAALRAARPFFAELGDVVRGAEVVLVPGNHDHRLLAGWHERRRARPAAALGLEQRISPRADEPAGVLAGWLGPAELTLAYPGLWLRPGVYAMHGHYLDAHVTLPTLERLAIGAIRWFAGPVPAHATPADYERALAPLYAWVHEIAQGMAGRRPTAARPSLPMRVAGPGRGDRPPRLAMAGPALPVVVAALNRAGLGPLRADVGVADLAPAALRAMGEACRRLGLDAGHVVFGHAHRAGPRPGDDPAAWTGPGGVRLVNAGSWVADPALAGDPGYRPGTCVRVGAAGPPVVEDVLDGAAPCPTLTRHGAPGAVGSLRSAVADGRRRAAGAAGGGGAADHGARLR